MKLNAYLKLTGEKPYQFADRARVRRAVVYGLNEEKPVQMLKTTMQRIVEASDGAISLEDLG